MDMNNNNDFFGDVKQDEFDENNISSSGINYGNSSTKSSLNTLLIAIGGGALVACLILLFTSKKTPVQPTNLADIPTISSPAEPIKIVPNTTKLNEVFETASVYKPTNFDDEAKALINANSIVKQEPLPTIKVANVKTQKTVVKPVPSIKKPQPKVIPETKGVKEIKEVKEIKKATVVSPKPVVDKPKTKLIEKATNVHNEVEITTQKVESDKWNVQITSTSSESAANKEWNNLVSKYPTILKGLNHTVSKTTVNGKIYYRLRISNLESNTKATEICNSLKANKVSCFITK